MKRFISAFLVLALTLALFPAFSLAGEQKVRMYGDYNGDGYINSDDYLGAVQYMIGIDFEGPDCNCCDMNSSGSIDSADILLMRLDLLDMADLPGVYTVTDMVIYPQYDSRIERDYEYDVTVTQNGVTRPLTCYNHTDMVAYTERLVNGDTVRRFCEFAFDDYAVRVDITVHRDFNFYTVMPSAKGFQSSVNGNVISVYLDKPDYFLLKLDDKDDSILSVFADHTETNIPDRNDPRTLYVTGWYETADGHLTVNGQYDNIYVAPGAVLNSRVMITSSGVKMSGRGMILDPYSNIFKYDIDRSDTSTVGIKGKNCTFDGLKIVDTRNYNLVIYGAASNTVVTNYKALSSEMCTDGITQRGAKTTYRHCFMYVGDNGIVITDGNDSTFEDITIGTICCALFPQNQVGVSTLRDIYVFRCDEGLVRNIHNVTSPGTVERTFEFSVQNINAVDVDHFPYIFVGANMGTLSKSVVFNNIAVPASTGSSKRTVNNGDQILFYNSSKYMYTDNYTVTFNGLSVAGSAVTDASELQVNTQGDAQNTIAVTGNGAKNMPVTPAKRYKNTVAPDKIFIGDRQLMTEYSAVKIGKQWYVPATEVCNAMGVDTPYGSVIYYRAKDYLSLDALVKNGITTKATYDKTKSSINIAPVDRGDNLLCWGDTPTHSKWAECVCYNVDFETEQTDDGTVFKVINTKAASVGCQRNLTQQVLQYGNGTYTLTLDMRSDTDTKVRFEYFYNGVKSTSTVNVGTDWSTYTVAFKQPSVQTAIYNAALRIVVTQAGTDFYFKNASLTHSK